MEDMFVGMYHDEGVPRLYNKYYRRRARIVPRVCAVVTVTDHNEMVEDCLIPSFGGQVEYDSPMCNNDSYNYGLAGGALRHSGSPAKVPPLPSLMISLFTVETHLRQVLQHLSDAILPYKDGNVTLHYQMFQVWPQITVK
jgi:hypothetical protein